MKLILLSTLHPTSTTGQGFGIHEGAPPSHDPQATMGAGGVWQLPLSNHVFDYYCYQQKCLLEIQLNLIYYQCPKSSGPHISPLGPPVLAPGLPQQGWSPVPQSPAQPCLSMEATKLGPQPILGSSHLQECAWCHPQLSPSGLCSPGGLPPPVLRRQPWHVFP